MNNTNLKLAIQKEGRLTEETLDFLRKSGFEFDSFRQKLMSTCRNFPLEILFVRDNDIPSYVTNGTVDLGIIGQNILNEERPNVKKLLDLRFGFCSLVLAVTKESPINTISELKNKKVATSYPNSTKNFFKTNNISVEIITISGSVEIAPILGVADAVTDLTSTGSTLAINDLRVLTEIYDSEAVLITNLRKINNNIKSTLIGKLITRFKGVLSAQKYKYVMMNAPEKMLPRLLKVIPGLKFPSISNLTREGWVSVATIIKEDMFWGVLERLKKEGVSRIFVLPIEKMIN